MTNLNNIQQLAKAVGKLLELRELDRDLAEIESDLKIISDRLTKDPPQSDRDYRVDEQKDLEERRQEIQNAIADGEKSIHEILGSADLTSP